MKIYHAETQEDFDGLMIEFEEYLKAMLNGYDFKLKKPKKYYWRKKKEHLAGFENVGKCYLTLKSKKKVYFYMTKIVLCVSKLNSLNKKHVNC